jgi:putative transposase
VPLFGPRNAKCLDWFDQRSLHGKIGLIPPTELEETYDRPNTAPATAGASVASLD